MSIETQLDKINPSGILHLAVNFDKKVPTVVNQSSKPKDIPGFRLVPIRSKSPFKPFQIIGWEYVEITVKKGPPEPSDGTAQSFNFTLEDVDFNDEG